MYYLHSKKKSALVQNTRHVIHNFYNKESEVGIIYNDPTLNINWVLQPEELIISNKDLSLPKFENI